MACTRYVRVARIGVSLLAREKREEAGNGMAVSVTEEQWNAVRESLRTAARRFCELMSCVSDPGTKVAGKWSAADVAAHVAAIAWIDTTLLEATPDPFPMPGLAEAIQATTVDGVHGLNDRVLDCFRERDLSKITAMLSGHVDLMLAASRTREPGQTVAWLADSRVTLAGLLAHLVNELLQHGYDIARAVKVPWAVAGEDAAFFFELFYVALAKGEPGRLLDGSKRPVDRRIAVEFRSGFTTPVTIVVRNGQVTAEPAGSGTDIKIRFDPAALNMMMFGRLSKTRAVLTGKVVVSGRRPWLLPAFLRTVRAPS